MTSAEETHEHRQLGGYKATLHNENASRKAKLHAAEVLEDHGISSAPDIQINPKTDSHQHDASGAVHKHEHSHAIGHDHGHSSPAGKGVKEEEGSGRYNLRS